ncbi:MAG: hypothetical protein KJ634_01820 [Gammaproteobacteria bacterium]|nr:hypothetical protein [Gammaproteobacteria bacterium]MBU1414336.1 hypothetical protein [Gammaproteobacteria bacterium]
MRVLFVPLLLVLSGGCAQLPVAPIPSPADRTDAVVFDIDGTLTPKVLDVFEARPDAAKAVRTFAGKGYEIFYVSTRVAWLSAGIPDWLKKNGFPAGSVHVAQTDEDRRHPYDFKKGMLKDIEAHGWNVKFAYGDSSTDFAAYADAGIPKEGVFALLREGEKWCEWGVWKACIYGWTQHLDFIENSVPPAAKQN